LKAATEVEARRGSVANTDVRDVKVVHPLSKAIVDLKLGFQSNIMVLDIYGGKDLSKKNRRDTPLTTPGEVLLLDPSGNMSVRSEIDDLALYNTTLVREEPVKKPLEDQDEKEDKKKPIERKPIRPRD
jgi:hypothetical protein